MIASCKYYFLDLLLLPHGHRMGVFLIGLRSLFLSFGSVYRPSWIENRISIYLSHSLIPFANLLTRCIPAVAERVPENRGIKSAKNRWKQSHSLVPCLIFDGFVGLHYPAFLLHLCLFTTVIMSWDPRIGQVGHDIIPTNQKLTRDSVTLYVKHNSNLRDKEEIRHEGTGIKVRNQQNYNLYKDWK